MLRRLLLRFEPRFEYLVMVLGLCGALVAGIQMNAQTLPSPQQAGPAEALVSRSVAVANGESLSAVVDLAGFTLVRIDMPAAWTAANLTVQTCTTSVAATCRDLYDEFGNEVEIVAAQGRAIRTSPGDYTLARYWRFRSGTSAVPVPQAADRFLILVVKAFK